MLQEMSDGKKVEPASEKPETHMGILRPDLCSGAEARISIKAGGTTPQAGYVVAFDQSAKDDS